MLFVVILFLSSNFCLAQNDSLRSIFQLEYDFHLGKLINNHPETPRTKLAVINELNFAWKTQGRKAWNAAFNFPSYMLSIVQVSYGNKAVLGQSTGAIPSMRFEKMKGNYRLSCRVGFGLAWFNHPFNASDNNNNLVIGSSITNMSVLRLDMSHRLAKKMWCTIGFSYTHCSNAHIAVPNIGANIASINVGLTFINRDAELRLNRLDSHTATTNQLKLAVRSKPRWAYNVHTVLGFQEAIGTTKPVDGPRYPVYGVGAFASWMKNERAKILFGFNYHYYPFYHDFIVSQELFSGNVDANKKAQTMVAFVGAEWTFNRLALFAQMGLNVYNPFMREIDSKWDLPNQRFFNVWTSNKLGYRFYFGRNEGQWIPFIHIAVKTNGGTADFFETAIGINIKSKNK